MPGASATLSHPDGATTCSRHQVHVPRFHGAGFMPFSGAFLLATGVLADGRAAACISDLARPASSLMKRRACAPICRVS